MLSNSATCYVAMYVHCTVSLGRTSHGLPVRLKQKAPLGWQTEKHPPWFSLPPDLVGTEIEHIFGFSDTDRWEGRVVIISGDTVTADRLKLAPRAATTLSSYATRGRLPLYHKSTNCPDQLFVISCRFFVSIRGIGRMITSRGKDIFTISGYLSLNYGNWTNINQTSEAVTPKFHYFSWGRLIVALIIYFETFQIPSISTLNP